MRVITKQTNPYPIDESVPFHEVDVNRVWWDTSKREAQIGELKFTWDRDTNFVYVAGVDQTFEDEETEEKHTLVSLQNAYDRGMKDGDTSKTRDAIEFKVWLKEERGNRKLREITAVFDQLLDEEIKRCEIIGQNYSTENRAGRVYDEGKESHIISQGLIQPLGNKERILTLKNMKPIEKVNMLIQKTGNNRNAQKTYCHFRVAQLYIGSISPKARALMDSAYDRLHKGDMTLIAETMNNNTSSTGLIHSVIAANDANGNAAVMIKSQFTSFRDAGTDYNAILENLQNMSMIDIAKTIANLNDTAALRELDIYQRAEEKHAEHMAKIDMQNAKLDEMLDKQSITEGIVEHIELELDAMRQDLFDANVRCSESEKREKTALELLRDIQLTLASKEAIITKTKLDLKCKNANFKRVLEDRVVAPVDSAYDGRFILMYNAKTEMYAVIRCVEKNAKRLINRYSSDYEIVVTLRSPNPQVLYKKIQESASESIEFSGVDFHTTLSRSSVIDLVTQINNERYML